MDEETRDESSSDGFMDRIKESPRTVSALIIILIVAAAIYAFSGEPQQPGQELANTDEAAVTDEGATTDEDDEGEEPIVGGATDGEEPAEATPAATTVAPLAPEQLQDMNKGLPAAEREGETYVEKAQAGDGITHLARRATTRWLAENNAGYQITNEHRVFIEDYIQNKLGSDRLSVDESRTISFDLISEAVKAAGELDDQQLRNLSRYTSALN